MSASLRFSIIIPVYNVADYISTCLESVLGQSFSNWEAIVINDGSTDASSKILANFKNDPRIKLYQQNNAGLSAARNAGIKRAKGEYLIFLDGDDFLVPNALTVIDRELKAAQSPDLLRFQIQDFYENGHTVPHPEADFPATPGVLAFSQLAAYHYTENAWAYAYRREFFIKHQFQYAEGCIAEDFGLTPLIIAKANTVKSISAICYNYRQRSGSIMNSPQKLKTRVIDSFVQLKEILPELAQIPNSKSITHYLVASFLTLTAQLPWDQFIKYYQKSKQAGFLHFLHPTSFKAIPRTLLAKISPRQFYRRYHQGN